MNRLRILCAVALLTSSAAGRARAGERYYLLVFGSQRPNVIATPSHTFATFVKVTDAADAPGAPCLEAHTISWLYRNIEGRHVARLLPEEGVNMDLHTTLRYVLGEGQRVSLWGPYRIEMGLYERAVAQQARLESGEMRYKAVDTGFPADRVANCIHAVSDLAEGQRRLRIASPGWGESASYFVTLQLADWILDPRQTHDWVAHALGLDDYPIVRRDLFDGNPTAGVFLKAAQAHRHRWLGRSPDGSASGE